MQQNALIGYLLALIGVFILSPDALLVRLAGEEPLLTNAWRGLIAGSMVVVFSHFLDKRSLINQLRPAGRWAWVAILMNALSQIGFVYGISHANVTNVLVIIAFAPLVSAFMSAWFLGEQVKLRTWVATLVCGVGLVLLLFQPENISQVNGLIAALICALSLAAQFVIIRGFPTANLSGCVGLGNILGGLICAIIVADLSLEQHQWLPIMLMALIVSPIPFTLFVVSLRYISAAETSLIILLESILGSLWVWFVLSEQPTPQTLMAGALVLGTLAVYSGLTLRDIRRPAKTIT